jgi:hypothetical protein
MQNIFLGGNPLTHFCFFLLAQCSEQESLPDPSATAAAACQMIQDLANEIERLKETRLVVYALNYKQKAVAVAEGFLETMETLTFADIPEKYSSLFDDEDDERQLFYAVKLQSTNTLIGSVTDLVELGEYLVRLEKTNSSVILGVFKDGCYHEFMHGCIQSALFVNSSRAEAAKTMVEINNDEQPDTKQQFYIESFGCSLVALENHPYWNDLLRKRSDSEYDDALLAVMDNAPEDSLEHVSEYLFFRPVDASKFLQNALR